MCRKYWIPGSRRKGKKMNDNNKKKAWSEYTAKEINDNKRKWCLNCWYQMRIGTQAVNSMHMIGCGYYLITKQRRGCSPIDCKRFRDIRKKATVRRWGKEREVKNEVKEGYEE